MTMTFQNAEGNGQAELMSVEAKRRTFTRDFKYVTEARILENSLHQNPVCVQVACEYPGRIQSVQAKIDVNIHRG